MAKVISTEFGTLVIHASVVSEGDRGTAKEHEWMSEVRVADGSTILVLRPANEKRVDLVIGCGGQDLDLFSAPGDRSGEMTLCQQKVTGLQNGDVILYRVKPDGDIVELTFTGK